MTQLAEAVFILWCWIMVFLRIYTWPCDYRDEACAWSCGRRAGHAGDHGCWMTDEWSDRFVR